MGEPQKQLLSQPGPVASYALPRTLHVPEGRGATAATCVPGCSNQVLQGLLRSGALQAKLTVNSPGDPYEQEAERTTDLVMRMPEDSTESAWSTMHTGTLQRRSLAEGLTLLQRVPAKGEERKKNEEDEKKKEEPKRVQKKDQGNGGSTAPSVSSQIESSISGMQSGGVVLPLAQRSFFENRIGYDFGSVRVHTDTEAAHAASALQAQAFTVGQHIFFGTGQYRPQGDSGRHLLAHELTHTIQQAPDRSRVMPRRAGAAAAPLTSRAPRAVQRAWYDFDPKAKALAWVAEKVRAVPFWDLLTVLLGKDPITDEPKERTAVNLVHAILNMVPDGDAIFRNLEESKEIDRTVAWLEAEVAKLNLSWPAIKALFVQARESLSLEDVLAPVAALERIKRIFEPTLTRLKNFVVAIGSRMYEAIKKKVLAKLAGWAKAQKGYELLTFILGKDLFTDEPVARTAKKFVHAVLVLVPDGEKIYANLEASKAIDRTVEWLEAEIAKLDLSWEKIKSLFRRFFDVLSVKDLLSPLQMLDKVADIFGDPVRRVFVFAVAVGKQVLVFIFEGAMMIAGPMGMQIVGIVRKVGDTFGKIVDNPVGFLGNLVQAVKRGFEQFSTNILQHLKTGIIEWLVGTLEGAGIVLPEKWNLQGVLSLVLQVLGITYAKMRAKMVAIIGEERVAMIERVFEFIKLIVTKGLAAAWEKILETVGNLWDLVIGGIRDWAVTKIVTAAITKLATMLNPVGAIIQAIIAIYNTIAFFVERIKQIIALVDAIVDSIANIAAGKLSQAANYVEKTMGRTIPVILGFLARLIGLGDVSGAIRKVVEAIQAKVDMAIDKMIAWVVEKVKSVFGTDEKAQDHDARWEAGVAGVHSEVTKMKVTGEPSPAAIQEAVPAWKKTYGFATLEVETHEQAWTITGSMSNKKVVETGGDPDVMKGLHKGVKYRFDRADERDEHGNVVNIGFYTGFIVIPGTTKTDYWALYRKTRREAGKEYKALALVKDDPEKPAFQLAKVTGPITPIPHAVPGSSGRPKIVDVKPIGVRTAYEAPREPAFREKRIKEDLRSAGAWVRGHLWNGKIGGPGSSWNLVPIRRDVNAQMSSDHETPMKDLLEDDPANVSTYLYFHAAVDYHDDSASKDIGRASDFAEDIWIQYGPMENDKEGFPSKEGKLIDSLHYEMDPPEPAELEPKARWG